MGGLGRGHIFEGPLLCQRRFEEELFVELQLLRFCGRFARLVIIDHHPSIRQPIEPVCPRRQREIQTLNKGFCWYFRADRRCVFQTTRFRLEHPINRTFQLAKPQHTRRGPGHLFCQKI